MLALKVEIVIVC